MRAIAIEEASTDLDESTGTWVSHFLGNARSGALGPQAFLARFHHYGVIDAYFHGVNQSQVIVGGPGRIGKRPVLPGCFHYADAFTPYGPIKPDLAGIDFFTLRQTGYVGQHRMPGSRELMKGKAGRNLFSAVQLGADTGKGTASLFSEPDGLRAYELRAESRGWVDSPPDWPTRHGGAYIVVLVGALELAGQAFPSDHAATSSPQPSCRLYGRGQMAWLRPARVPHKPNPLISRPGS
jgi:hypothetical protein